MDEAIKNGFRFLRLQPFEVYRLTPREFYLMMEGRQEQIYDELEIYSLKAIMMRRIYHENPKKELKATDLFKRPDGSEEEQVSQEELKKQLETQQAWLNQFQFKEV